MIKTRQISLFLAFTLMLITFFASASTAVQAAPADDLVIVGVIDGPLSGGVPKAVSLYAINAIPDLSVYGIGAANNGGGTDGEEFTFPAVPVPAGTCIYVASEAVGFTNFFGFAPDYTSFAASINGDDAIELFANESVSDIFGDINVDGSGQPWDHVDGWAYRNAGTGPDGSTFTLGNWSFSGINALDGETTNATAATPFPINAYAPCLIVDTAPMVASTVPANSAAAIALDASLEITFNEDVTVTEPWLALVCSTSGIHTTVTTGGPQVYTVNPDSDFVNDETCTATITATQVADQDGTADNLAADVAFTFATESSVALSNLVINEISADPDATNGDANGDGTVSTTQDEFVEIVNINGADIDISGWTLSDAVGVRHTFPIGSVIPDSCSIVVFGAGTPTGTFGGSIAQTASTNTLGLNNTGDTVTLNDGISDVAVYAYGSEGGDNQSLTRDPDITGSDPMVKHTIATGANGALFSPGTQVDGTSFSGCPIAVSLVKIHEVQGSGASSPLTGQMVMIEGVVVGDFQDNDPGNNGDLNGFFVQEEDADADSDPSTSEGVFVFDGSLPAVNVAIGDVVRVVGRVDEFFSLTEIVNVSEVTVISSGNALPTPATVILPISAQSDLEAFEGMSVSFPQSLTIVEYFNFDRFGEIVLATDRLFQPTAVYAPGSVDAINLADANSRSIITLDDGRTASNPDPAIHPNGAVFDLTNSFRGGDLVTNAAGVLHYAFNLYRIHPTQGADYTAVNPRTSDHEPVGGSLEVASFNVLNYFNGDGLGGGFPTSRGADDVAEFARQRDKIVAAMVAIDADVLGLMEIENDGYGSDSAIQDLVNGLNAATAPDTYAIVDPGVATIGTDAIAVGLIYKPATATPQ
ncbi:MAG: putative extracellular nuclease, partial [Candidatus Promineifilaceae bacterium]